MTEKSGCKLIKKMYVNNWKNGGKFLKKNWMQINEKSTCKSLKKLHVYDCKKWM